MPTIWIVNHYAGGPEIGTGWRHWELARRWTSAGAEVRIFTASTSIGGQQSPARTGQRVIDGVPFHFLRVPAYRGNGLGRLVNVVAFNRATAAELDALARHLGATPDLLIASSPQPLMWSALSRTARTLGTCFAVEIRDLWPESLQQLAGLPSWHPFVLACRRSDRIGLRRAAAVLSPLERVGEAIRARGFPNLPCIHIPNGVSIDVEPLPPLDGRLGQLVSESREEGRCIALYAGAIGVPNALDQFIEALEIMPSQERNSWRVLIVGEGSERERLARRVRLKTLPVAFIGSQPQQQVRALCRACDVGLIGWLDRPLYRFGIAPQKRSLMLGEGLPVLHAVPHGIINESALGTGWSVDAGDARGIAGAMKSARETTPWHRKNMRSACLRLARKTLDWDVIATESLEQLREIIVNHRRGR